MKVDDFNSDITQLINDVEFDNKLISLDSESQVKKHFEDYNVQLSDEESNEIFNLINKLKSKIEELPNNQLKDISGGVSSRALLGMCSDITSCLSGIATSVSNCIVGSTKAKCESNERVAKIKAESKVNAAKYMAADHIVGYALVTALAVYYIKKRTSSDSKK